MPELIERGYIYIGLPPLYKVTQGKQITTSRTMRALAFLLAGAVDGASLILAEVPPISGVGLEQLMQRYSNCWPIWKRLSIASTRRCWRPWSNCRRWR